MIMENLSTVKNPETHLQGCQVEVRSSSAESHRC